MKYLPLIFAILAVSPFTTFAQTKIDIGQKNDRKDVLTKDAENWIITDGPSSSQRYNVVTFTLRPGATGGTLAGALWKGGIDTGATLVTDGVIIKGAQGVPELQLTLSGLTPGKHSLVTFHNFTSPQDSGRYSLSVDGTIQVPAITPPHRILSDYDAATTFVEFTATAGKDVVISFKAEKPADMLILNGLLLDGTDPAKQIAKPLPAPSDEHVAEKPTLTWRAGKTAISHDIYFGTDLAAVENATHASPEFKGNQKSSEYATAADDSWLNYFWRVDEINSDSPTPVKGTVSRFRVAHLAFPEAEGYGRFAIGGRGGKLLEVTNLNDSGPGSLRAAVDADFPRTIVFRVGGTINLKSKLVVSHPYCTIAGQTAPGDGILLRGWTSAAYGTHDVILRYLRVRIGDENITLDGSGLGSCDYSIMDHCSISWSIDESFSSRGAKNITLQRTLISEALNMSIHDHYVGTGKGHSFAARISGDFGSFHHNLLVNCAGRV
ncbi:MAG TPA: T9SS C-terminal target domain-containing protein, partial [Phycisphaerae bacterium]